MTYDYEFYIWPHHAGWDHNVYELFRCFPRVVITLTETQFALFRASNERAGFTFREVTRIPHSEPEIIS
jgi:hypothetical protein